MRLCSPLTTATKNPTKPAGDRPGSLIDKCPPVSVGAEGGGKRSSGAADGRRTSPGGQAECHRSDEARALQQGEGPGDHLCVPGSGLRENLSGDFLSFPVWLKVNCMFSICFFLITFCRQRSTPRTSTRREQPGRSSTRRRSVWPLSWSTSRSRTHSSKMRLIHLEGTASNCDVI